MHTLTTRASHPTHGPGDANRTVSQGTRDCASQVPDGWSRSSAFSADIFVACVPVTCKATLAGTKTIGEKHFLSSRLFTSYQYLSLGDPNGNPTEKSVCETCFMGFQSWEIQDSMEGPRRIDILTWNHSNHSHFLLKFGDNSLGPWLLPSLLLRVSKGGKLCCSPSICSPIIPPVRREALRGLQSLDCEQKCYVSLSPGDPLQMEEMDLKRSSQRCIKLYTRKIKS